MATTRRSGRALPILSTFSPRGPCRNPKQPSPWLNLLRCELALRQLSLRPSRPRLKESTSRISSPRRLPRSWFSHLPLSFRSRFTVGPAQGRPLAALPPRTSVHPRRSIPVPAPRLAQSLPLRTSPLRVALTRWTWPGSLALTRSFSPLRSRLSNSQAALLRAHWWLHLPNLLLQSRPHHRRLKLSWKAPSKQLSTRFDERALDQGPKPLSPLPLSPASQHNHCATVDPPPDLCSITPLIVSWLLPHKAGSDVSTRIATLSTIPPIPLTARCPP